MVDYKLFSSSQKGEIHNENQDSLISRVIDWPEPAGNIYLVGVADGVTNTSCGGSVARWLSQQFERDYIFFPEKGSVAEQFKDYIEILREMFVVEFEDNDNMLNSASTLSVAAIQGSYAECFWVGDSPIFKSAKTLDAYETERISTPDLDQVSKTLTGVFPGKLFEPHYAQSRLAPDDVLTMATDGLRHKAQQINEVYAEKGVNKLSLDTMVDQSIMYKGSDDCSISIAHRLNNV